MQNEFLDEVLTELKENGSCSRDIFETKYSPAIVITKLRPAIQYLKENNFINAEMVGTQEFIKISATGERHLVLGGFSEQSKYNSDILTYSKGSNEYAKKAYYVSIFTVILTVILFIISLIISN